MKNNQASQSLNVLKKFRIIFGSVRHHFSEVETQCGISGSQVWLLNEIAKTPEIGISEIAERLSIHQSTCSQLVDKLVKKGFVSKVRSSTDQRRVALVITLSGQKVVNNAPGPAEGLLPDALQSMTTASLTALEQSLVDLIEKLEAKDSKYAGKPLSDI